jgi:hypothetical protein
VVDQRVQPVRPDLLVDDPVPEPGRVVTAVVEPAVVEHEPLHADARRAVRDLPEPVEVVVEVHGLPDVQHHRLHVGMRRQRPLEAVPRGGQAVEPVVGGDDVHPGRGVRRAGRQRHLTRQQPLAAADGGAVRGGALDPQHVVAAPADVHADDVAVRGGEPGGAGDDHGRGVEPRPPAEALAQPQPVRHLVPLRGALALVPAGEVEDLDVVVGQREHDLQPVHDVVALGGVRDRGPAT